MPLAAWRNLHPSGEQSGKVSVKRPLLYSEFHHSKKTFSQYFMMWHNTEADHELGGINVVSGNAAFSMFFLTQPQ